jgi:hypothetical protein
MTFLFEMKRLFSIIAFAHFLLLGICAQGNVDFGETKTETDGNLKSNQAAVVFVSSTNSFTINPIDVNDKVGTAKQQPNGKYATEIICDLSKGDHNHSFNVLISGTSLGEYKKIALSSGKRFTIEISQALAHNLYFEYPNTQRGYTVNGKSAIEFIVPDDIDGADLSYSQNIGGKLTRSSNQGINILTLEIDCDLLKKFISDMEASKVAAAQKKAAAEKALEDYQKYYDDNMTKDGFNFDAADKKVEELQEAVLKSEEGILNLFVNFFAKKSNAVPVDLTKIKALVTPKNRLQINIGDGLRTKTVFRNRYEQLKDQADREYRQRKYNAAAKSYREAANDPSANQYDKETCLGNATQMDLYSELKVAANSQIRTINDMKAKGGMIDYNLLEETYNAAIQNFQTLKDQTQDEYYEQMIGKLISARNAMGQVIVGTTTKGGYHQGQGSVSKVTDVDIYGLQSYGKLKELKEGIHGEKVGEVTPEGTFHLQLEKGKYRGLLFVPRKSSGLKQNEFYRLDGEKHMKLRVNFYN